MITKAKIEGNEVETSVIVLPSYYKEDDHVLALKDAIWDMVQTCMSSNVKDQIKPDTGYYMLELLKIIENKL